MSSEVNRRSFLGVSAAGLALSAGGLAQTPSSSKPIRLGFVGVGNRGSYHLDCALGMEGVEVVALCDIDDHALYRGKRWVEDSGHPTPHLYGNGRTAFLELCEKESLDCVVCCTPWQYHTPVCVAAMKNGKNAVSEVPICITLEEAWELVETHESTAKWATLGLEGFGDLTLMNMVRQGLMGEVLHAEGGYVHDLRMVKFSPTEEPWRLEHSATRNGNLYPDHPMARILRLLDINHGDRFDRLVSMSTKAVMLAKYAALKYGPDSPAARRKYMQGDVNVTLLHTEGGKMVTLNFDTDTPHPREFFRLQGTKAVFMRGGSLPPRGDGAPAVSAARAAGQGYGRGGIIYVDGRSPADDQWESAEPYFQEYQHPFLKAYKPKPRKAALRGHGGGSTVTPVNWERLVAALRAGIMPDWDVYDSVTSSAISPLTEKSVAGGNVPVEFPDFTKGKWKTAKPYEIEA
jgi:Glycosyl hydrolase 109, C-terminal domain/Oxidoreductase family, NAD-binding Rossmann fold